MEFFNINVNVIIIIHPISKYKILGVSSKNNLFELYAFLFLNIPQVTNSFDFTAICFSRSPIFVQLFVTLHFVSYTPFIFGSINKIFFHEEICLLTTMTYEVQPAKLFQQTTISFHLLAQTLP